MNDFWSDKVINEDNRRFVSGIKKARIMFALTVNFSGERNFHSVIASKKMELEELKNLQFQLSEIIKQKEEEYKKLN